MAKSYMLKLSGREEGPYTEAQIAQMFSDNRVDRHTPCKVPESREWKSIDDYLPTLKYGTQLPPPTPTRTPAVPTQFAASQRVAVVDLDIPFASVLKIMFKWIAAGLVVLCCFLPVIFAIVFIIMLLFAGLIGGALSHVQHP